MTERDALEMEVVKNIGLHLLFIPICLLFEIADAVKHAWEGLGYSVHEIRSEYAKLASPDKQEEKP